MDKRVPASMTSATVFFAVAAMLLYYSYEKPLEDGETPLFDIVHHNVPKFPHFLHDAVTVCLSGILLYQLYATKKIDVCSKCSLVSLIMFRMGLFYTIRSIMNYVTVLPSPDSDCADTKRTTKRSALQKMMSLGGDRDCIPSGHAGFVFILLASMAPLGLVSNTAFVAVTVIQLLSPTVTRSHYTVDPIVSFFMAVALTQLPLRK